MGKIPTIAPQNKYCMTITDTTSKICTSSWTLILCSEEIQHSKMQDGGGVSRVWFKELVAISKQELMETCWLMCLSTSPTLPQAVSQTSRTILTMLYVMHSAWPLMFANRWALNLAMGWQVCNPVPASVASVASVALTAAAGPRIEASASRSIHSRQLLQPRQEAGLQQATASRGLMA